MRINIMKKSKRFAALFATVLMAITMFTGSSSAYAKSKDFDCGKATSTGYVSSATSKSGSAWTKSIYGKSFSYLYIATFGTIVDKINRRTIDEKSFNTNYYCIKYCADICIRICRLWFNDD